MYNTFLIGEKYMNNPLISIIIPLHNLGSKGDYCLKMCLDSILAQTFQNYEVLLMENGSTDDTTNVAQEYCNKDNRFKLHILDILGVSNARNKGLDLAKGSYISFIDGDDRITELYYSSAMDILDNNNDIAFIQFNLFHYYLNNNKIKPIHKYNDTKIIKANDEYFFSLGSNVAQKVIRKSIIDNLNLRFDTELDAYEDFLFASELYLNSSLVAYSDKATYYYIQNRGSQTTKYHYKELAFSHILFNKKLKEQYIKYNIYDKYSSFITGNFITLFIGSNFAMTPVRKLDKNNLCKLINECYDDIMAIDVSTEPSNWQTVWFKRFQKAVKHNMGYYFIKFMRLYRNLFIQPFKIKWYK